MTYALRFAITFPAVVLVIVISFLSGIFVAAFALLKVLIVMLWNAPLLVDDLLGPGGQEEAWQRLMKIKKSL